MNVINGETYNVYHQRKGRFNMLVKSQDEEWVTGLITHGKANAICDYNVMEQGEEITIRKIFCSFILLN